MKKRNIGNLAITVIVLLNIVLWLAFPPESQLETPYGLQYSGEILASSAMILIALGLVLAAKPKFLESFFGGLDQMYKSHKNISMLAFLLIIAHFFLIPDSGSLVVGKPLGMIAFLAIVILVLVTIAPRVPLISRFLRLPYDRWRISHKLLGLFFVLGLVHFFLVDSIAKQTVPGSYMLLFCVIGILAYLYKQFLFGLVRRKYAYVVDAVDRLNGTALQVTLKPQEKQPAFDAGQFVFLQFEGDKWMREAHPFTVSSAPAESNLRLCIKGSGDWTNRLVETLTPGTEAKVDGAYGRFNYKTGGKYQVWIAGGIGVTPFLSWIRDADNGFKTDVDFFYGVRSHEDALFWDEFQAMDTADKNFRANIRYSSVDGHLSAQDIAEAVNGNIGDKDIYLCGPIAMTEGFARQFKKMGVPAGQIHYEEFNFR